jgi:hypothetical protein
MLASHDSHEFVLWNRHFLADEARLGQSGVSMSVSGVWAGLADSAFVADVDDSDRRPARIAATIVVGLAAGFVVAMAGWILVSLIYVLATGQGAHGLRGLGGVAARMADVRAGGLALTLLRLGVATATDGGFLLAFVAVAAFVARRRLRAYVTAAPHIRWRLFAMGVVLSALFMAPLVAADRLLSSGGTALPILTISPLPAGRFVYALSTLLLIPAAAAEELFFRGWLLRQMAAFSRRPAVLIGVTALIFSAVHFDFSPDGFLTRALMGAGFAYMTLRLGGIEFSAGVHTINNTLIVLFLQPLSLDTAAASPNITAGSALEDIALIAGYILITEVVARAPLLRRWAGLRSEVVSRTDASAAQPS